MKKTNLSKLLILLMTVIVFTGKTYGDTEAVQMYATSVQPTVAISVNPESILSGDISYDGGIANHPLKSIFNIETNGTDDNYHIIVTSAIDVEGGKVSAFGKNGSILFANIDALPTISAVENAKNANGRNANVIAYPMTSTITSPMTVTYQEDYNIFGDCYVVLLNNGTDGTLINTIGQTPVDGTYEYTHDQAGKYHTVITLTAVGKE